MKPGDTISRYRIVSLLGRGGMGLVYRADDLKLQRPVALKFLSPEAFTEASKQRFLHEARSAAQARHPNICPIYDIEETDGELFIAMAYLEGETLQGRIQRSVLAPAQAADIAAQIAAGLDCAHRLGIIHRDIKSSNIMLDPSGHASIMDFGLALSSDSLRVTGEGSSVGTPAYMSPEQIRGRQVDSRTDIWSLGVVLFEMLTARLPFRREHREAVMHAILNDPAPEISEVRPGVPTELQKVISKALQKHPAARWQSAAEMAAALKANLTPTESMATETMIIPVTPARRKWMAWAALGIVLAAAGGYGVYRLRPAAVAVPVADAKRIVVLPFLSSGPVGSTADGVGEILTSALDGIDGITVAPSADVRRRKIGTTKAARQFYNANLVIFGTAQPVGDQVEFNLQLVDAASERQLGTRKFIYDPKNPIVSRDQAVNEVARMIGVTIPAAAVSAMKAGDTSAPDAYSAYLEGRGLLARYDLPGNIDRAIASFHQATKLDQKFALAYAGLGEAYWRKARVAGDSQALTLANQNAEFAVQLEPGMAILHSVLGAIYDDLGRQSDAIREFQRAMQLAPNNAEAPRQLAEVYRNLGRFDDAEALYIRSTKARPTDWYGHLLLGLFYYERERYAESEAEFQRAKALTPDNITVRLDLGGVLRMEGRYPESVAEYEQALRIRSDAATYAALGGAYYYQHKFVEAVSAVEAAIDLDSNDYRYWGNLGIYYRQTPGNEAKSEAALRKALEMAAKVAETRKSDFTALANIAEYRARLGDSKGALAAIEQIPEAVRGPFTTRLAIVYELTGHRDRAIAVVRALKSPATLTQVKNDPALAAVWRETRLQ